jgi:putative transcriptional regulator
LNNFRPVRKKLGLSQGAIAKALGVTQSNISHIESGNQGISQVIASRLILLAATSGVRIDYNDLFSSKELIL